MHDSPALLHLLLLLSNPKDKCMPTAHVSDIRTAESPLQTCCLSKTIADDYLNLYSVTQLQMPGGRGKG